VPFVLALCISLSLADHIVQCVGVLLSVLRPPIRYTVLQVDVSLATPVIALSAFVLSTKITPWFLLCLSLTILKACRYVLIAMDLREAQAFRSSRSIHYLLLALHLFSGLSVVGAQTTTAPSITSQASAPSTTARPSVSAVTGCHLHGATQ